MADNQLREWLKLLLDISEALEAGYVATAEHMARQLHNKIRQEIDDKL